MNAPHTYSWQVRTVDGGTLALPHASAVAAVRAARPWTLSLVKLCNGRPVAWWQFNGRQLEQIA